MPAVSIIIIISLHQVGLTSHINCSETAQSLRNCKISNLALLSNQCYFSFDRSMSYSGGSGAKIGSGGQPSCFALVRQPLPTLPTSFQNHYSLISVWSDSELLTALLSDAEWKARWYAALGVIKCHEQCGHVSLFHWTVGSLKQGVARQAHDA
jgi:hypothetical protein